MLRKISNLQRQISSTVVTNLNIMDKYHEFFKGKRGRQIYSKKTSHCYACSVQNIRIHFNFTLLQQSFLCQLRYCAVCMSVTNCTTGVPSLQTVLFIVIAMEI